MTPETLFLTIGSPGLRQLESDRAVLSRIMPIVTSAVRTFILYIDVEHSLVHQLGQPRRLLWFHLQGDHPSEAELDAQF